MTDVSESTEGQKYSHADMRQQGRWTVYQSGGRLFGAGDHIGLVVDLEGHSGQTGRQMGQGRSDKS